MAVTVSPTYAAGRGVPVVPLPAPAVHMAQPSPAGLAAISNWLPWDYVPLEPLIPLDGLHVQKVIPDELWYDNKKYSHSSANRYVLRHMASGEQLFISQEASRSSSRRCCPKQRPFQMVVYDNLNRMVLIATRHFKCCAGCNGFGCALCCDECRQEIKVEAPEGNRIGIIKQAGTCCTPKYSIIDEWFNVVMHIEAPTTTRCCCCPVPNKHGFNVFTAGKHRYEIGRVGFVDGPDPTLRNSAKFGVTFPTYMNLKAKALILASYFLIDYLHLKYKHELDFDYHGDFNDRPWIYPIV